MLNGGYTMLLSQLASINDMLRCSMLFLYPCHINRTVLTSKHFHRAIERVMFWLTSISQLTDQLVARSEGGNISLVRPIAR